MDTADSDSEVSDVSDDDTDYNTDDEVDPCTSQANLFPLPGQNLSPDVPLQFDVDMNDDVSSSLPLGMMMNARSAYNKRDNLYEILHQICPSFVMISETWEREKFKLDNLINSRIFKSISYYRKNRSPGGGCAIIYKMDNQFNFKEAEIDVPENIEAAWAVCTPVLATQQMKVKRIAIGSIYK